MAISLEQAKSLKPGQVLYHVENRNADRTPQRWKVNGQPKTWKTNPSRVQVPLKHGMYDYGYLTESDLESVCLREEDAIFERIDKIQKTMMTEHRETRKNLPEDDSGINWKMGRVAGALLG